MNAKELESQKVSMALRASISELKEVMKLLLSESGVEASLVFKEAEDKKEPVVLADKGDNSDSLVLSGGDDQQKPIVLKEAGEEGGLSKPLPESRNPNQPIIQAAIVYLGEKGQTYWQESKEQLVKGVLSTRFVELNNPKATMVREYNIQFQSMITQINVPPKIQFDSIQLRQEGALNVFSDLKPPKPPDYTNNLIFQANTYSPNSKITTSPAPTSLSAPEFLSHGPPNSSSYIVTNHNKLPMIQPFQKPYTKPIDANVDTYCLVAFHSFGYPLEKAEAYDALRKPFLVNELEQQHLLHDRRKVHECLESYGIPVPRYAFVNREKLYQELDYFVEEEDFVEVHGQRFWKGLQGAYWKAFLRLIFGLTLILEVKDCLKEGVLIWIILGN